MYKLLPLALLTALWKKVTVELIVKFHSQHCAKDHMFALSPVVDHHTFGWKDVVQLWPHLLFVLWFAVFVFMRLSGKNLWNTRSWKINYKKVQEVENLHITEGARGCCRSNCLFLVSCWWSDCSVLARNAIHKISHCSGKRCNTIFTFLTAEARYGFMFADAVKNHHIECSRRQTWANLKHAMSPSERSLSITLTS